MGVIKMTDAFYSMRASILGTDEFEAIFQAEMPISTLNTLNEFEARLLQKKFASAFVSS